MLVTASTLGSAMGTDPREPAPGRADARRNRERILTAAAQTLGSNPNASLADIADAAGVGRATIYRHFADVDAVLVAIEDDAVETGRKLLQQHLKHSLSSDGEPTFSGDLPTLLHTALGLQHRWTAAIAGTPVQDARLVATFAPLTRAVLRRGQARGEFRTDVDLDVVSETIVSLALLAARRVHSDGLPVDRAVHVVLPFVDGLRRPAIAR